MRYLKKILFLLFGLALACFFVAYISLPKLPDTDVFYRTAKQYNVEVFRDNLGIPHIYGQKDIDTAFGLGYVQSEDDFTTLQSVLLATRGQLAAHAGKEAAQGDFVVHYMGVWDAIHQHYETQVPENIKLLAQAYADGINLFAAKNEELVSRYLLPVTAQDIIAGFTFKSPMFYGFDKVLGDLLNPAIPHEFAKEGLSNQHDVFIWKPAQNLPIGSQGIAIAPSRSEEGATHLLINSHQPLRGPVAWYEARLHSEEGWDMAGSTFPGSPVIVHGHNKHLGWANTVNKPDLVDIYKLTLNPDDPNQYKLDGQWLNFEIKKANILVKIFGPLRWTFKREIKRSVHGPVMETERGFYALRWAGMQEVRTLEFMFKANKATNKQEFEAALAMQAMPSINFVYADKQGNIGHYYNAKFPNRIEGWEWQKILPGNRSELIWTDYRKYESMPKTVNPKTGLVYNANNPPWFSTDGTDDPKPTSFPGSMGIESFVTNRALQIEALLKHRDKISLATLRHVKYNLDYHPESYQIKRLKKWLGRQEHSRFSNSEVAALKALSEWNLSTYKMNTEAALAVLTLVPIQAARGAFVTDDDILSSFKNAVLDLEKYHGSFRVPYGDVFRLKQGDKNFALSGGPDVLRAVYGKDMDDKGEIEMTTGDGFTMFVSWDNAGSVSSRAIHQYGAATNDKNSPHFNDQMEMFIEHKERQVLLELDELLPVVTRQYKPLEY